MRGTKGVVLGLATLWKTRDAAKLTQPTHLLFATRQNLMRIGLMANVPDDAVMRRVVNIMQGDSELHRSEVRGKMATRTRDRLQHKSAQLVRQLLQAASVQPLHIGWTVNAI